MDSEARLKWLQARKEAIGGSDAPAVLGVSPRSSPLAVWADKLDLVVEDFDDEQLERMEWGQVLEPVILDQYSRRRGLKVERHDQTVTVRHQSRPELPMACTPDGYDEDGRLVQVKNVDRWLADDWEEGPPLYVTVQEQHEMAVTGIEEATVVALIGGNRLVWYDIEKNDAFIASLEDKLHLWWNRYVVNRVEPPADGSDSCVRTLERLHPNDTGEEVFLGEDFGLLDARLNQLKAEIKALQAERKEAENRIKAAIGSATFGRLPSGSRYSWKTQERKEYTAKAATFRTLRRHGK